MDFNFDDLNNGEEKESYNNPWLQFRQQYVDMLAAGFSKDEAMMLLIVLIKYRMELEMLMRPRGASDNNS